MNLQPGAYLTWLNEVFEPEPEPAALPAECERCGCITNKLYIVEDRDDAVGYCGDLVICGRCMDPRSYWLERSELTQDA